MSGSIGLIVSELCQISEEIKNAPEREVNTEYGVVTVKEFSPWVVICRSFYGGRFYLPHEYRSAAHIAALKSLGLNEVVGVHSSGSLRPSLAPGMLVIPDDWIDFTAPCLTTLSGQRRHLTPSFSHQVRQKLADAAWKAEVRFENGGIYWQSRGPRLETKAEIKVMSNFADLVGMGMSDEANLAQEMGLEYGAICSVDNYAHGLGFTNLSDEMIHEQLLKSSPAICKVIDCFAQSS